MAERRPAAASAAATAAAADAPSDEEGEEAPLLPKHDMLGLEYQPAGIKEYDAALDNSLICKLIFALFVMALICITTAGIPWATAVPPMVAVCVLFYLLLTRC